VVASFVRSIAGLKLVTEAAGFDLHIVSLEDREAKE